MNSFKIVPLSKEFGAKIRKQKIDAFNNEVVELVATGFGPCRISLKPFTIQKDKRLLLKYSPFEIQNAFNQPGPIFIHAEDVEPYADIHKFPPRIKSDKKNFPITLIGYSENQEMNFTKLVGNKDVDELIDEIFRNEKDVAYLHARNSEAACFICKIERE